MSLEQQCLKCIIINLPYYNALFKTTQDQRIYQHLELLRRSHSAFIISELFRRYGFVKEVYIDFLINKYLKELDMKVLNYCTKESVIQKISEVGHKLVKVTYQHHMLPPDQLEYFVNGIVRYLTDVRTLVIPFVCNDETLRIISSTCKHLQELDIHGSKKVTNDGLKALCIDAEGNTHRKSCLKILDLDTSEGISLYDEAVMFLLTNIPTLETVNYYGVPKVVYFLHKNNFKTTPRRYNLLHLNFLDLLKTPHLSDALNVCVRVCPNVKKLFMPILQDRHLTLCCCFRNLVDVHIEGNPKVKPYKCVNEFVRLRGPNLKDLSLSFLTIAAPILVQSCPNLQLLNLKSVAFQSFSDAEGTLYELTDLNLDSFNFSDAFVEMSIVMLMRNSPRLEDISLSHCLLTDIDTYRQLFNMCQKENLKNIDFSFSDVKYLFIREILISCPSLHSVNLELCEHFNSEHYERLVALSATLKNRPEIIWSSRNSFYSDFIQDGDESDNSYPENEHYYEFGFPLV